MTTPDEQPLMAAPTRDLLARNEGVIGATVLEYDLDATVAACQAGHTYAEAAYRASPPGSLLQAAWKTKVDEFYLVTAARDLVNSTPDTRNGKADDFTGRSIGLYGAPDAAEMGRLLLLEQTHLERVRDVAKFPHVDQNQVDYLLATYEPLVASLHGSLDTAALQAANEQEKVVLTAYGNAIHGKFPGLIEAMQSQLPATGMMTPQDFLNLTNYTITRLKQYDSDWGQWSAQLNDSPTLATDTGDKQIGIGRNFALYPPQVGLYMVCHELLAHALQSLNGYKTGDMNLANGTFAGAAKVIEGSGGLIEASLSGAMPVRLADRYFDTGLALATLGGRQRTRQEMKTISYARQLIRAQLGDADQELIQALPQQVCGHIDRIYSGSPGDNIGTRQGVDTYDSGYFVGYTTLVGYLADQMQQGRTADQLLTYLSSGMFDPTSPPEAAEASEFVPLPALPSLADIHARLGTSAVTAA